MVCLLACPHSLSDQGQESQSRYSKECHFPVSQELCICALYICKYQSSQGVMMNHMGTSAIYGKSVVAFNGGRSLDFRGWEGRGRVGWGEKHIIYLLLQLESSTDSSGGNSS